MGGIIQDLEYREKKIYPMTYTDNVLLDDGRTLEDEVVVLDARLGKYSLRYVTRDEYDAMTKNDNVIYLILEPPKEDSKPTPTRMDIPVDMPECEVTWDGK